MRQFMATTLAAFILGSGLLACGGNDGGENSDSSNSNSAPGSTSDEPVPAAIEGDATKIVASVGDQKISLGDINLLVKAWQAGRTQEVDPRASVAELQQKAIDNLIEQKLILRAATDAGLTPSEDEFDDAMGRVRAQFPDEAALTALLKDEGMNLEQFTNGFRSDMTIRFFVEKAFLDTINITDGDAEAYYAANPENFISPPQVSARHILIRTTPDGSTDAAAKTKVDAILARARGGEDFVALAKETTEDETTRDNGGDLGYFAAGVMVPEFDQIVFALEVGGVSDVVKTQFGYHIIKVEDKRPEGPMDLADVAPQVKEMLKHERAGSHVSDLVERMKTEIPITREI